MLPTSEQIYMAGAQNKLPTKEKPFPGVSLFNFYGLPYCLLFEFQTCHAGSPLWYDSSKCCLSLKVSIDAQNPSYLYVISSPFSISLWKGSLISSSPFLI